MELVQPGSSEIMWGDITGTLSNQTDLQVALDAKANTFSGYTGDLQDSLGVVIATVTNGLITSVVTITPYYLLQEDGFYILQENGDKIIL